MAIKFGNTDFSAIKIGNLDVAKVMVGDIQIYPMLRYFLNNCSLDYYGNDEVIYAGILPDESSYAVSSGILVTQYGQSEISEEEVQCRLEIASAYSAYSQYFYEDIGGDENRLYFNSYDYGRTDLAKQYGITTLTTEWYPYVFKSGTTVKSDTLLDVDLILNTIENTYIRREINSTATPSAITSAQTTVRISSVVAMTGVSSYTSTQTWSEAMGNESNPSLLLTYSGITTPIRSSYDVVIPQNPKNVDRTITFEIRHSADTSVTATLLVYQEPSANPTMLWYWDEGEKFIEEWEQLEPERDGDITLSYYGGNTFNFSVTHDDTGMAYNTLISPTTGKYAIQFYNFADMSARVQIEHNDTKESFYFVTYYPY